MKTTCFCALFIAFNTTIFAQMDRLNFYLPGIRWGMTRVELSENRPIEITNSGGRSNSNDVFFSENLDSDPILKAEYGFGYPDSIGLLSVQLTCIDRASAKVLAIDIAGSDLNNGAGAVLKLSDGSGLNLMLLNEKVVFQWRPLRLARVQK